MELTEDETLRGAGAGRTPLDSLVPPDDTAGWRMTGGAGWALTQVQLQGGSLGRPMPP